MTPKSLCSEQRTSRRRSVMMTGDGFGRPDLPWGNKPAKPSKDNPMRSYTASPIQRRRRVRFRRLLFILFVFESARVADRRRTISRPGAARTQGCPQEPGRGVTVPAVLLTEAPGPRDVGALLRALSDRYGGTIGSARWVPPACHVHTPNYLGRWLVPEIPERPRCKTESRGLCACTSTVNARVA